MSDMQNLGMDKAERDLARKIASGALLELGYLTDDLSTVSEDLPPSVAWKAWCLGVIATGRTPLPFDEWPAWIIEDHPRQADWWRHYFTRHGVSP